MAFKRSAVRSRLSPPLKFKAFESIDSKAFYILSKAFKLQYIIIRFYFFLDNKSHLLS